MMKTIIFLHGFFASGSCVPAIALKEAIAHFEPIFLEHYSVSHHFPGAHTPSADEIKAYHVPLIRQMLSQIEEK